MKFCNPKKQQKFSKIDLEKAINDMFASAQALNVNNSGYTFITNSEGYNELNRIFNQAANQVLSIHMPEDWYNNYSTYSSNSSSNTAYNHDVISNSTTNNINNNLNTIR